MSHLQQNSSADSNEKTSQCSDLSRAVPKLIDWCPNTFAQLVSGVRAKEPRDTLNSRIFISFINACVIACCPKLVTFFATVGKPATLQSPCTKICPSALLRSWRANEPNQAEAFLTSTLPHSKACNAIFLLQFHVANRSGDVSEQKPLRFPSL